MLICWMLQTNMRWCFRMQNIYITNKFYIYWGHIAHHVMSISRPRDAGLRGMEISTQLCGNAMASTSWLPPSHWVMSQDWSIVYGGGGQVGMPCGSAVGLDRAPGKICVMVLHVSHDSGKHRGCKSIFFSQWDWVREGTGIVTEVILYRGEWVNS